MLWRMEVVASQKQILIVDRDVATIEPLRERLKQDGFLVRAITDGAAAAGFIEERPPQLIIVDWNMPGLAALQLIERVQAARRLQPLRLIILSDLSGEQDVVSGFEHGRRRLHCEAVFASRGGCPDSRRVAHALTRRQWGTEL